MAYVKDELIAILRPILSSASLRMVADNKFFKKHVKMSELMEMHFPCAKLIMECEFSKKCERLLGVSSPASQETLGKVEEYPILHSHGIHLNRACIRPILQDLIKLQQKSAVEIFLVKSKRSEHTATVLQIPPCKNKIDFIYHSIKKLGCR